ncbi:hypothetical protein [Metabacillus idriensis]|uniref:hypothetical protein n=1 Tax=Metabacillus idriensis TaxID=324768 RepID=UPI003D299E0C
MNILYIEDDLEIGIWVKNERLNFRFFCGLGLCVRSLKNPSWKTIELVEKIQGITADWRFFIIGKAPKSNKMIRSIQIEHLK